jgi:hypothetical protein
VHYDASGGLQKIVNEKTGEFLHSRARADGQGVTYLLFDKGGTFEGGASVYQANGKWFNAPVLGGLGQITGNLSGTGTGGSFALQAKDFVFGTPVELSAHYEEILNNTAHLASPSGFRLLDLLVSSAYAQAIGTGPYVTRAAGGVFLTVVGGALVASGAGPLAVGAGILLIGAGVAKVGWTLYDGNQATLDQTFNPDAEAALDNRVAQDMQDGHDVLTALHQRAVEMANSGLDALRGAADAAKNVVDRVTQPIANLVAPTAAPEDDTVQPSPLPTASGDTSLTGTVVDSDNAVYNASGMMTGTGGFSATATSTSGGGYTLNGQIGTSTGTVNGSYTRTGVGGGTGSISEGRVGPMGQCQTSTQSGGNGTFSYAFDLGKEAGTFDLSYEMYTIPDAMTVVVGGTVVFTTGGLVSGGNTLSVIYMGGSTAFVNFSAPNNGTAWDFSIGCGH